MLFVMAFYKDMEILFLVVLLIILHFINHLKQQKIRLNYQFLDAPFPKILPIALLAL